MQDVTVQDLLMTGQMFAWPVTLAGENICVISNPAEEKMPCLRCCVTSCDNDDRYPEKYVLRSHVSELRFHNFPSEEEDIPFWV